MQELAGTPAGRDACTVAGGAGYSERHRPAQTLRYQVIEQHDPGFSALMVAAGLRAASPSATAK